MAFFATKWQSKTQITDIASSLRVNLFAIQFLPVNLTLKTAKNWDLFILLGKNSVEFTTKPRLQVAEVGVYRNDPNCALP